MLVPSKYIKTQAERLNVLPAFIYVEREPDFVLAASVSGANLATELCCQQQVDLILMDVQTENRENGLTAAAQIKREHPQIKMPDWAKNLESAQSDEGRLAGHYTMYAIDLSGTHYDYAALLELDMIDNSYIDIEYDKLTGYTGEICFDGEEPNSFTYDEVSELLTTDVGELLNFYESESGVMCLVYEELGRSFYFALDSVERSGILYMSLLTTAMTWPLWMILKPAL